jgi:hypothetical protein
MDYELLLRFALNGARFKRVESVLAAFRSHPASKTAQLRAVHDEEYCRIFEKAKGRPLSSRDVPLIAYHRLKRYWKEPRGFVEGLKFRLKSFRAA